MNYCFFHNQCFLTCMLFDVKITDQIWPPQEIITQKNILYQTMKLYDDKKEEIMI